MMSYVTINCKKKVAKLNIPILESNTKFEPTEKYTKTVFKKENSYENDRIT